MSNNNIVNGSRWWKIDFHAHTPESNDYKQPGVSPDDWVRAACAAGLDAVVVADHNSGGWIDRLRESARNLGAPVVIIPGVEITVNSGLDRIHLLAIFDLDVTSAEVTAKLGAVGILSGFGDSEGCYTTKSFQEVTQIIQANGGIVVPAHINGRRGLLENRKRLTPELRQFLKQVSAAEICEELSYTESDDRRAVRHLACVGGSDAHCPDELGRHYSWIKVRRPTLEALSVAFIDHENCVQDQGVPDPNQCPDFYINKLEISKFTTCGNDSRFPLSVKFSPHLTSLIGGRGTGKSTVIEALRILFRKSVGQESTEILQEQWQRFRENVTTPSSHVCAEFSFHGSLFKLHWTPDASRPTLEEFKNEEWEPVQSGDVAQRFGVVIFSQKQIFDLSENSRGLLALVDGAEEVNRKEWDARWASCKQDYLQLCAKARELRDRRNVLEKLSPELADLDKKIATYQKKGFGDVLRKQQILQRQQRALSVDEGLTNAVASICDWTDHLQLAEFPDDVFMEDDPALVEVRAVYDTYNHGVAAMREGIVASLGKLREMIAQYEKSLSQTNWHAQLEAVRSRYETLVAEARATGEAFDHAQYERLLGERMRLYAEVQKLPGVVAELDHVVSEIKSHKLQLENLRDELFRKRCAFLDSVVGTNPYVRMSLVKYGDVTTVERDFREIFSLDDGHFVESIYSPEEHKGILRDLIEWEEHGLSEVQLFAEIENIKAKLWQIAHDKKSGFQAAFDKRLLAIYQGQPAAFNEASIYLPEDKLVVKYPSDGGFKAIEGGASAGQKSAAILAFLLSSGTAPLIVDQPEDDLDNSLIMDLVVRQLHVNKVRRQMIIATHNPNIVVNGDSELVDVMSFKKGQIHCELQEGLESRRMRKRICQIMEGGEAAFTKRYHRMILEEDANV